MLRLRCTRPLGLAARQVREMLTGKNFARLALGVPAATAVGWASGIDSTFGGVNVDAETYSFRDRPLDDAIAAMCDIGRGYAELTARHNLRTGWRRDMSGDAAVLNARIRPEAECRASW